MAARREQNVAALALPWDAEALEELAANDGDVLRSSYTEAGPGPGVAVAVVPGSLLVPVVSGAQSMDLELVVLTGGVPQLAVAGAVQLGYRAAGETDEDLRGWSPPNWLSGWTCPLYTTSGSYDVRLATIVSSQLVALAYRDSADRFVTVYDPSAHTWSPAVSVRGTGDASDALASDGRGRLICLAHGRVYRSDDDGDSWDLHSSAVFGDDLPVDYTSYEQAQLAISPFDQSAVWVAVEEGTDTIVQCASDDGVSTLQLVTEEAAAGTRPQIVALPAGGYLLAYVRASDSRPVVRRLAGAWEAFGAGDEVEIDSTAAHEVTLAVDPDGLVWAHYAVTLTANVKVAASIDGGVNWTVLDEGLLRHQSTADLPLTNACAASAAGAVFLAGNWVSSATTADGSVQLIRCGGWTTLPASVPGWSTARDWTGRSGTGPSGGTGDNATWTATEAPQDNGWTATGAGAATIVSPGRLVIATTANTRYFTRATGAVSLPAVVQAELQVGVGSGAVGSNDILLRRRVSWVGHEHQLAVRFTDTQIRVRDDVAGTTLATITVDCTEDLQVLMLVRGATAIDSGVWYRRAGETRWTEAWTGALADNTSTPAGTGELTWGHVASASASSSWLWVTDCDSATVGQGVATTPAVGRPISFVPIPLPHETGATGAPAWLAATGGPAALGEQYDVEVVYDYAVDHLCPTLSPSPDETWRTTTDATEVVLAWDLGERAFVGYSLAIPLLRANVREWTLEYHDGSGWVESAIADLATGFVGLNGELRGSCLTPGLETIWGARYVHEGELAGGHVVFSGTIARRIRWNTAGVWTGGSAPQVTIQLDGIDGSEDPGTVDLVWPSGVLVVHEDQVRRRWRLRIAVPQPVPEDYIEAGVVSLFALRALGAPPDWGWSRETEPNAVASRSRTGTTRVERRGRVLRRWSMGWPSGVDLRGLREAGTVEPSWEATEDATPQTAAEDVPWLLDGLLEAAGSGAVPVVALASVPLHGTTVTDPSLWLYGRLEGSVRLDHITGREGSGEIVRVAEIVIAEVV